MSQQHRAGDGIANVHSYTTSTPVSISAYDGVAWEVQLPKFNINSLDVRFKEQHFSIIDLIDEGNETTLAKEQEVLDAHDEELSSLLIHAQQLIKGCSSASDTGSRKVISRNFVDLKARIDKMETAFATLSGRPEEMHLYHHYQEQIQDFKGLVMAVHTS